MTKIKGIPMNQIDVQVLTNNLIELAKTKPNEITP